MTIEKYELRSESLHCLNKTDEACLAFGVLSKEQRAEIYKAFLFFNGAPSRILKTFNCLLTRPEQANHTAWVFTNFLSDKLMTHENLSRLLEMPHSGREVLHYVWRYIRFRLQTQENLERLLACSQYIPPLGEAITSFDTSSQT